MTTSYVLTGVAAVPWALDRIDHLAAVLLLGRPPHRRGQRQILLDAANRLVYDQAVAG